MPARRAAGTEVLDALVDFFEADDWAYEEVPGTSILRAGFKGENGSWRCYAQADEEKRLLVFYSELESRVPEGRRDAVARFLARANYGLMIGNFEIDLEDGEVRYKSGLCAEGGEVSAEAVRRVVYVNLVMMDRYFPGLMSVIYADADPDEAIRKLETRD